MKTIEQIDKEYYKNEYYAGQALHHNLITKEKFDSFMKECSNERKKAKELLSIP